MLIDTHAHLSMSEYSDDLDQVIDRARKAKVSKIITVGFDFASSVENAGLAKNYENIYAAVGVHPHHAEDFDKDEENKLRELAKKDKVVAIGETGLDYFRDLSPKDEQIEMFRSHLRLAQELNKPVIIHSRDASEDIMKVIKEEQKGQLRGVMHCFAGDEKLLAEVLGFGFFVSITGIVTFPKAGNLRKIVELTPLDKLMIETDCPYLSPEPYRGKRNEPAYVKYVAEKIAEVKKIDIREVEKQTTKNAEDLFKI